MKSAASPRSRTTMQALGRGVRACQSNSEGGRGAFGVDLEMVEEGREEH